MNETLIPEDEQQNVLDVLWVLLMDVEESVHNPRKDLFKRLNTESAYNLLNRIGYTKTRPRWEDPKSPYYFKQS